jgi:hypothetical protein
MLILDDIYYLHRQRNSLTYPLYLQHLLKHTQELQYQDGSFIIEFCAYLKEQITTYAKINSPVYKRRNRIISKDDLVNKKNWYVPGWAAAASQTGGSTTGNRFHYLRWSDVYFPIEGDNHYRSILQEFQLDRPIHVLYLMLDQLDDRQTDTFTRVYNTQNILISHGMRQLSTVHDVIKNRLYYNDYFGFYEKLLNYLSNNDIDVILAPGWIITALAWNIKRLNHTAPICKLLSNTGAKVSINDLNFLLQNRNIENWCDHMRCWDGGVTFFTCRHHTAHLLDGLAWAYSDKKGRLISYDFYSLPSPFVNYWNGDHSTIGTEYKRCKCGRSYREFSIDRTRTVAINGVIKLFDIINL